MNEPSTLKPRFPLSALFVLMLGIAIGHSLDSFHCFASSALATLTGTKGPTTRLPEYVLEPPDTVSLLYLGSVASNEAVQGMYTVGPDGRINFPGIGSVYLNGMTLHEAGVAIAARLGEQDRSVIVLNVLATNSKKFYVVTDDNVTSAPFTGNETVMDGIAIAGGIQLNTKSKVWIARPSSNGGAERILPVRFRRVGERLTTDDNHRLHNGDRLFVRDDG